LNFAGVADTHVAIWYVFNDARLSKQANAFIDLAESDGRAIAVSTISLAEIVYLVEKGRVPAPTYEGVRQALADPDGVLVEAPLTVNVVEAMRLVPRDVVPDMPDRIIAATARFLNVPVISRDGRIRASSVETIW
jgi:PIN domain nuclease of toxin-antitoxin system